MAHTAQRGDCDQIRGRRIALDLKHMSRTRQLVTFVNDFDHPAHWWAPSGGLLEAVASKINWALQCGGKGKAKDGEIFILNH